MSPLLGILGIAYSLYYVFTSPSAGFSGFLDYPSLVLLGLMPPSIMLLSHNLGDCILGIGTLLRALFLPQVREERQVINLLTKASSMVRSEGIGSLVNIRKYAKYPFLKDGLSLIINNYTSNEIRHNLQNKIDAKQNKLSLSQNFFENMSKLSPGVGMIGTLMGLIEMMANLKDPSQIGSGMALAMITTFYGLLLGTVVYGPFSEKIALEAEKSQELDFLIMESIVALKERKSSIHMKDIVNTYAKAAPAQKTA